MQRAGRGSVSSRVTAQAVQATALTCLAAAFGTKQPSAAVAATLKQPMINQSNQQETPAVYEGVSQQDVAAELMDLASSGAALQ